MLIFVCTQLFFPLNKQIFKLSPVVHFNLCCFLVFHIQPTWAASEKVLIQSVAVVGSRVLTSRETRALLLLDLALADRDLETLSSNGKNGGGVLDSSLGRVSVEDVAGEIFEVILNLEAESFSFNQITPTEFAQKLDKVKRTLKNSVDWTRLEVSDSEVARLLRMKLVAKAYLNFKTTTMTSQISDSEAMVYFEKNKVKFGGLPFDQMKNNIKNFLSQQQLEERLKAYLEAMKRKYKVRNILSEQIEVST